MTQNIQFKFLSIHPPINPSIHLSGSWVKEAKDNLQMLAYLITFKRRSIYTDGCEVEMCTVTKGIPRLPHQLGPEHW